MFPIRRVIETTMVTACVAGVLLTGPVAAQASAGTAAPGRCSQADVDLAITISHLVKKDVSCHEAAWLRYKGRG
jgi:hypothetical protein